MRGKMAVSVGFSRAKRVFSRTRLAAKRLRNLKRSAHRAQRRALRRDDASAKVTERDLI